LDSSVDILCYRIVGMFKINRMIGLVLIAILIYGVLKTYGFLPDWMPALPFGPSRGA
jgi:hypothetical protein